MPRKTLADIIAVADAKARDGSSTRGCDPDDVIATINRIVSSTNPKDLSYAHCVLTPDHIYLGESVGETTWDLTPSPLNPEPTEFVPDPTSTPVQCFIASVGRTTALALGDNLGRIEGEGGRILTSLLNRAQSSKAGSQPSFKEVRRVFSDLSLGLTPLP